MQLKVVLSSLLPALAIGFAIAHDHDHTGLYTRDDTLHERDTDHYHGIYARYAYLNDGDYRNDINKRDAELEHYARVTI